MKIKHLIKIVFPMFFASKQSALNLTPVAKSSNPILHNLKDLKDDTFNFFEKNCSELGRMFIFRVVNRQFFVLNHPDYLKHVLVDNITNYSRKKTYSILAEMLGTGLITSEGEVWRQRRRIAQPAFSKDNLNSLIKDIDSTVTNYWELHKSSKTEKIELDSSMNSLALNMLCTSIIKTDLNDRSEQIRQNLNDAFKYISNKRFRAIKSINIPTPTKIKGRKAIAELKQTILSIIENRRSSEANYHDLLSMLMGAVDEEKNTSLTNDELLDEVMTLFVAGHDTTAVVLNWAFYFISKHPEVQNKILEEINSKDKLDDLTLQDIMGFEYTRMVVLETMRLRPPVWAFGRKTIEKDVIDGFEIPANTSVNLPTMFIHRNSEFWEKPEAFYPEHFSTENVKKRPKYAYLPFGGGQRKCIGEHYAMMEMILTIIRSVREYEFSLVTNEDPGLILSITIKPKKKIWVNIKKRN
jgi:cytochrome P450|tara:strand:+ start:508 stop:1908 length:1401 start_codon:yes stop_codon:yes gene_type:complete